MRIISLTVLVALFSANVFSATVESVTCHQRWPWDGKVEIDYALNSSAPEAVFDVKFYGKVGEGENFILTGLEGDGASGIVLGAGRKRTIWDAAGMFPNARLSGVKVALAARDVTSAAEYLILDLDDYTFSYASSTNQTTVSEGSDSKISEIWFRRIEPATYYMGSFSNDWSYFNPDFSSKRTETRHEVSITKGFYIGIFELTEAQFARIDSGTASACCLPKTRLSYGNIRGTVAGATWPLKTDRRVDPDSFLGRLRAKAGNSVIIDVPTEGQWELSCRSKGDGTFLGDMCWNNGSPYDSADGVTDNNLDKVAWYQGNSGGVSHEVGLKEPNFMGLYDMHGNVWEWCIDWHDNYYGLTSSQLAGLTVDPVGRKPAPNIRNVRRCGSYSNTPVECRSARRNQASANTTYADYGTRLVLLHP